MRYCSYRIAFFVILQYESNTDLLSQNILHILNQSTSLERGLLSFMFDITTIELSVRSSLLDTVLNRNTGILKKRWIKRACPNYDEIDACLIRITSKLGEILTYAKINGISPTVDFVLLELKKNREYELRPNRVDIFDALERYITEKSSCCFCRPNKKTTEHFVNI